MYTCNTISCQVLPNNDKIIILQEPKVTRILQQLKNDFQKHLYKLKSKYSLWKDEHDFFNYDRSKKHLQLFSERQYLYWTKIFKFTIPFSGGTILKLQTAVVFRKHALRNAYLFFRKHIPSFREWHAYLIDVNSYLQRLCDNICSNTGTFHT